MKTVALKVYLLQKKLTRKKKTEKPTCIYFILMLQSICVVQAGLSDFH